MKKDRILKFRAGRKLTFTQGELKHERAYEVSHTEGYFAGPEYDAVEITSPLMGFGIPILSGIFRPRTRKIIAVLGGDAYPLAAERGANYAYRAPVPHAKRPAAEDLKAEASLEASRLQVAETGVNKFWAYVMGAGLAVLIGLLALQALFIFIPPGIERFQNIDLSGIATTEEPAP